MVPHPQRRLVVPQTATLHSSVFAPSPTSVIVSVLVLNMTNFLWSQPCIKETGPDFGGTWIVQWSSYQFIMCVSIAAQQLSVFSAERCISKTAGLLRLYAVLPHCDSVLANNVQRGPLLCQPRPIPHQAHLCFLLHTSSKAQILFRLDTR